MKKLPYKSLQRLNTGLLFATAIFFTTSLVVSLYLLVNFAKIKVQKSNLLSRDALQKELLKAQPLDRTLYPNAVRDIAYVLNPIVGRSSWKVPAGYVYNVNALGLRGGEIPIKQPGVRRVLLVGDSVLFGWEIKDEDRLSNLLNAYIADSHYAGKVEFITIALPGWNIKSENAFLESHMLRLSPDVIVWSVLRNDIDDAAGVIPPGVLAWWASPHQKNGDPFFAKYDYQRELVVPSILKRWHRNLQIINHFNFKYKTHIVLLSWREEHAVFFKGLLSETDTTLPYIIIPVHYHKNKKWGISEIDGHPTRWANEILKIGILSKLSEIGFIPKVDLTNEASIVETFHNAEVKRNDVEARNNYYRARNKQVPTSFDRNNSATYKAMLFGMVGPNMFKRGGVVVRNSGSPEYLEIGLHANIGAEHSLKRQVIFEVSNGNISIRKKIDLREGENKIYVPIPSGNKKQTNKVYELSWNFNFVECTSPSSCYSAKLDTVQFNLMSNSRL